MDYPVVASRCGYEPAGFSASFGSGACECASVCRAERYCSCVDDHLSCSVSDTEARVIATVVAMGPSGVSGTPRGRDLAEKLSLKIFFYFGGFRFPVKNHE